MFHRLAVLAVILGLLTPASNAAEGFVPMHPPIVPFTVTRPFDPPAVKWGSGHRGVDIAAAVGTPIFSPAPGIVTFAGHVVDRMVITIKHTSGLQSSFEPISAPVAVGTQVNTGDVIAHVAPGHHPDVECVHWGVRLGKVYLDPASLLGKTPRVVLLPHSAWP